MFSRILCAAWLTICVVGCNSGSDDPAEVGSGNGTAQVTPGDGDNGNGVATPTPGESTPSGDPVQPDPGDAQDAVNPQSPGQTPASTDPPEPDQTSTDPPADKPDPADRPDTPNLPNEPDPADKPGSTDKPGSAGKPAPADKPDPAKQPDQADANVKPEDEPVHPFAGRIPNAAPDFPKDMQWINSGPISMKDLRGKFVLLDFWTYCCINCIHILPELKKLERAYPNELVVIGVHSAKFDTEKDMKNIREAVLRYEIEHPVVNDPEHVIWKDYEVRGWPGFRIIDPQGNLVAGDGGEQKFEVFDGFFKSVMPYYRKQGLLDTTPIRFDLERDVEPPTPLRFPGKVLADEASQRLFISDSNHNRIVITSLEGELLDIIGDGRIGKDDGDFDTASFDHPQGVVLHGTTLYVADTENHNLRKINLETKQVTTIAGQGKQARHAWPGLEEAARKGELPERWVGKPLETDLNSPWALWVHGEDLYIAMAGPHQIWKMPLDESEIGPFAGDQREDIVDGRLLPELPPIFNQGKEDGVSSFAQPSGLASDGEWLFVADSEGSSIRAVPFDPQKLVRTVVGSSHLPGGRLFEFGDVDGSATEARLQHALGVAYHDGKIYVADTYNNKIKTVDAKTGDTVTLVGTGEPGRDDETGTFDEPAGISFARGVLYVADTNNHRIRTVDIETKKVGTLEIDGLQPPKTDTEAKGPKFDLAAKVDVRKTTLKATDGKVKFVASLALPAGVKINPLAPMRYQVSVTGESGPLVREGIGQFKRLDKPAAEFPIELPVNGTGDEEITISMNYYYCQADGTGLCKMGSVVWAIPLTISDDASADSVAELKHAVLD